MSIKLFKDLNRPLTHRDLDENFESVVKIIEELGNTSFTPEIALGPTMTISSGLNSIPNTRKFVGIRPQSGNGINYTYAKDADLMFRRGSNNGGFLVDDEGNSIKFINTRCYMGSVISADGKWIISVQGSYDIYVANVETGKHVRYSISSFWSGTNVTNAGGCLIDGEDIYIPGDNSSTHYVLKIKIDSATGALIPVTRITTGRTFRSGYNAYGKDQIVMSNAGDTTNIYNVKTMQSRNLSHPASINDNRVAFIPIGLDSDGKAHFICLDWDGGSVYDIKNIYVEDNGSLIPHAVSQAVSNQMAVFGEMYSYNWPSTSFTLMELEVGNIYTSFLSGYDQSPTVFYNPDTFEFASLSDQNEALFITKKA